MHPYSTNESRIPIYSSIAVFAVAGAWAVTTATSHVSWPQWLVSAPSLAGMFALGYRLFDNYIWRWRSLARIGIVGIPDVSGAYQGELVSTYKDRNGDAVIVPAHFRITQTWTRIKIEMEVTSGTSTSVSTSALGSMRSDGTATRLTYVYANRINPALADDDMGDHDGTADLRIYPDGRVSGRYYNSRPRAGTIQAQRIE